MNLSNKKDDGLCRPRPIAAAPRTLAVAALSIAASLCLLAFRVSLAGQTVCGNSSIDDVHPGTFSANGEVVFALDMVPCETLAVQIQATVQATYVPTVQVFVYGQTGEQLFFNQAICNGSCSFQVPKATDPAGYPYGADVGPRGLPGSIKLKVAGGVPTGQPYVTYTLTATRSPRPGYNEGGRDFTTAKDLAGLPRTVYGSYYNNEGQFFRVLLASGGTLSVSGTGTASAGAPYYGANLWVQVYNASQQLAATIVNAKLINGTKTFTSSTFTNNTGSHAAFYLKVYANVWLQDLQMTVTAVEPQTCVPPVQWPPVKYQTFAYTSDTLWQGFRGTVDDAVSAWNNLVWQRTPATAFTEDLPPLDPQTLAFQLNHNFSGTTVWGEASPSYYWLNPDIFQHSYGFAKSVAAHELGHSRGYAHVLSQCPIADSIMYPHFTPSTYTTGFGPGDSIANERDVP